MHPRPIHPRTNCASFLVPRNRSLLHRRAERWQGRAQGLQVLCTELLGVGRIVAQDRIGERGLFLLQRKDLLLDAAGALATCARRANRQSARDRT